MVMSIWRMGGWKWDFHGEWDSAKRVAVVRVFCGSGEVGVEILGLGSSSGLGGVVLQGWFGQRGCGLGCPRER